MRRCDRQVTNPWQAKFCLSHEKHAQIYALPLPRKIFHAFETMMSAVTQKLWGECARRIGGWVPVVPAYSGEFSPEWLWAWGLECPDKCSNYADVQQLNHVIEPLIRGLVCDTQTISVLHQIYRKVPFPQT